MADLDGFKALNDTYGHAVGDQVLVAVAQALRDGTRKEDAVGRLGGEEFLVVLPDADARAAAHAAERMRARGGRGGRSRADLGQPRLGRGGPRRAARGRRPARRRGALRGQGGGAQSRLWGGRGPASLARLT